MSIGGGRDHHASPVESRELTLSPPNDSTATCEANATCCILVIGFGDQRQGKKNALDSRVRES